ncbi:helix-turn-helix domain-containing protein [Microbacterium sp. KNMS]
MNVEAGSTRARRSRTYFPEREELEELLSFAQVLNGIDANAAGDGEAKLVAPDGSERRIPAELFQVLEQVANVLALGDGVTVMPYATKLTTQEAADFLGVSRPTLVKLLETGAIAHEKVGRHRRVTLRDVAAYQERSRIERRAALADLARETAARTRIGPDVPELKRKSELDG